MSNLKLTYVLLKLNSTHNDCLEFVTMKDFFSGSIFIADIYKNCWHTMITGSTFTFTL